MVLIDSAPARPLPAGGGVDFQAADLLHLLEVYEGVIAARPIEAGNREFLLTLLASAHRLATALQAAPESRTSSGTELARVVRMVHAQTPDTAKEAALAVLAGVAACKRKADARSGSRAGHLYLRGTLPPARGGYTAVTVVFGPGLGLGDQITFLQFLRAVRGRFPDAPLTVFTLYPGLWPALLPGVRELHYRRAPLRPFVHLRRRRRRGEEGRELVLVLDFECFDLHRRLVPRDERRDVVEVALGRRAAWLAEGGSPWVRAESFAAAAAPDNYALLAGMADRLFPGPPGGAWREVRGWRPGPARAERVLLLNPLTSKRLHLEPADWHGIVSGFHERLPPGTALRVLVYPGVHPAGRVYAEEICRLAGGSPGLRVELLGGGGAPVTPYAALPLLVATLEEVDLCLTIDTFTAHLVPLFGIPTVTVTDRENRDFWVPAPWSIVHVVRPRDAAQLGFVPRILAALADPASAGVPDEAARALLAATRLASDAGLDPPTIAAVHDALARVLGGADPELPYRRQGQEWLLAWSYLASAMRREPITGESLHPYLQQWTQSPFLKLVGMSAAEEAPSAPSSSPTA